MVKELSSGFILSAHLPRPESERLGDAVVNSNIPTIIDIFKIWNIEHPSIVDTVHTVVHALSSKLGVRFTDTEQAIIFAAAKLAEEENQNPYHSNKHFLEVFALSALLGSDAFKDNRMNGHQFSLLLSAALIHDYKHDGTNNKGQRYRLEDISLSEAESALKQAGATDEDWELLKAFIHTTDVSKDFSNPDARSPAETVKIFSMTGNPDDLLAELRILAETSMADISLMLEDADLSCGLMDAELFEASNHLVAQEQGRETNRQSELFFINEICHRQLFSISGKRLIQPYMDKTLQNYGLQHHTQSLTAFPT